MQKSINEFGAPGASDDTPLTSGWIHLVEGIEKAVILTRLGNVEEAKNELREYFESTRPIEATKRGALARGLVRTSTPGARKNGIAAFDIQVFVERPIRPHSVYKLQRFRTPCHDGIFERASPARTLDTATPAGRIRHFEPAVESEGHIIQVEGHQAFRFQKDDVELVEASGKRWNFRRRTEA